MASLPQASCWIGIDVAKDRLDVHLRPSEQRCALRTDAAGLAELVRRVQAARPEGIVLEASGGLERPLTHALAAAGVPYSVVNPRRLRAFATGLGWLAKTDRIDARALARYGELARPQATAPAPPQQLRLAALSARRRQLLGLKGQEANRLARVTEPLLQQQLAATLALLARQLAEIDAALTQALARDPELAPRAALIQSMPGAGPRLAQALLAGLPELGQLNRKQIASLAGLAPHPKDSGRQQKKRAIQGGRGAVRRVLDMAAMAAIQRNPACRALYRRLLAHAKPPKLALTAVMRTMLTTLNAMLRHNLPWHAHLPA